MKIEKTSTPLPSGQIGQGKAGAPQKDGASATSGQPASTSVSLGSAAAHLRSMEGNMAGSSPVDAAKVAEIKQAISEGRFKVNSEVVADRLIATVRDLIRDKA